MSNTYKDSKVNEKRIKLVKKKSKSRLVNPFDGSIRRTVDVHKSKKKYDRKSSNNLDELDNSNGRGLY